MSSRNLLNVILLLLLAGLLAVAIYEPGKPEKTMAEAITNIDLGAVKSLRLDSPGRAEVVLIKQGEHWRMQQPFAMPANDGRVHQLLKLTQAQSITRYPLEQVDLQQLQLHDPILVLTVDGQSLRFGTTTALDEKRYVQVGDSVHLINDRYSHLGRGAASGFVSPALLPAGSKIKQLRLASGPVTAVDAAAQSLLNEWRQARAQKVTRLENNDAKKETVELTLDTGSPIRFAVLQTDTEVIFQRADFGLQYHFALEAGQRLLTLPATESADAK